IAWRLPGIVLFTEILGLPTEEVATCVELGEEMFHSLSEEQREAGGVAFNHHVADLMVDKAQHPPGDSALDKPLPTTEMRGKNLSLEEICEHAQILVAAGLETTSGLLSNAYYYLARRPDERDRLISDSALLPTALEEFFRFLGSVHGLSRFVTRDTE